MVSHIPACVRGAAAVCASVSASVAVFPGTSWVTVMDVGGIETPPIAFSHCSASHKMRRSNRCDHN